MFMFENEKQKLVENDQIILDNQTPHKVSLQPIKSEKLIERSQFGRNSITNVRIEIVELTRDGNNNDNDDSKKIKLTLLEKAMIYREQNPEKWQQRVMENQRRINELLGMFEPDVFLENYYKTLTEAMRSENKQQQKNGVRCVCSR